MQKRIKQCTTQNSKAKKYPYEENDIENNSSDNCRCDRRFCGFDRNRFCGGTFIDGRFLRQDRAEKSFCYYTEKTYLKDGEFDTLALLIDRAVNAEDKKRIARYALAFCLDEEFSAYCIKKDSASAVDISYFDFYGSECVSCLYDDGSETPSAELAVAMTSEYTTACPLATAISLAVKNGNAAYAKSVLGLYEKNGKDITCDGDALENDVARLKTVAEA